MADATPEMTAPGAELPLEGVRVLDLSSFLSGPFTAMLLGDLGADVLKVERPPKGDPLRRIGHRFRDQSVQCINVNRNKRSVFLDLTDAAGRDAVLRLAAWADVVVQNWRPGVADSLGLGDETLSSANPRLVRLSVTGYGPNGPLAARPAFDALLQAQTGVAWRQRVGDRPVTVANYIADKVTSLMAAQAVLAALLARQRTSRGQRIEISMLDALAYFNFPDVMEDQTFLEDPAATALSRQARSMLVATADGHLAVAPATGAQLRRALSAVGHPEWAEDLRTFSDPLELLQVSLDRIESVTVTQPTAVWLQRFGDHDVPAAPVLDSRAHLSDPQVVHNGIYVELLHPELGRMRAPRFPARFGGRLGAGVRLVPPRPGEHTREVHSMLYGEVIGSTS